MNILIVDFEFPEPDRSSGGHRLYHIIELLREAGHKLAFLSIDYWQLWKRQDECYPEKLRGIGVQTYRDGHAMSPEAGGFIEQFDPDVVVLSKYYMANMLVSYLRVTHPSAKLILDTVDVHFLREKRAHKRNWAETRTLEMAACTAVDRVWAITQPDADVLKEVATKELNIHIVPNIHDVNGPGLPFGMREDIVFVGNYVHEPNKDAIWHMGSEILSRLRQKGCDEPFKAVGPYDDLVGYVEGVEMTGYIEDLDDLLSRAKVGVAPLRYGAGMKGKIGSYMCNGLPVVTTSIGAEGMGLVDGQDALIRDDPAAFADAVKELCEDETLWKRLSLRGLEKVTEWGSGACKKVISEAVEFM
jgi:glycosyltransferase involved in cell wall biosynthesis